MPVAIFVDVSHGSGDVGIPDHLEDRAIVAHGAVLRAHPQVALAIFIQTEELAGRQAVVSAKDPVALSVETAEVAAVGYPHLSLGIHEPTVGRIARHGLVERVPENRAVGTQLPQARVVLPLGGPEVGSLCEPDAAVLPRREPDNSPTRQMQQHLPALAIVADQLPFFSRLVHVAHEQPPHSIHRDGCLLANWHLGIHLHGPTAVEVPQAGWTVDVGTAKPQTPCSIHGQIGEVGQPVFKLKALQAVTVPPHQAVRASHPQAAFPISADRAQVHLLGQPLLGSLKMELLSVVPHQTTDRNPDIPRRVLVKSPAGIDGKTTLSAELRQQISHPLTIVRAQ